MDVVFDKQIFISHSWEEDQVIFLNPLPCDQLIWMAKKPQRQWWCNGTFGQFDDWPKITPFWHPQKNLYNITITTPFNITTAAIHSALKMRKYCKSLSWTYFKTAALTQIFNQFPRFEICSTLKWSFLDFPKSCTFLFLGTL